MVCEMGAFLKARTFMKKSILFAALLCLGNLAVAENLQFVTTLSSPLGTFAQLETADPTVMAKSPVVNFCNTRVSAGTITLNGANSYLQKLNLKASTTLGGNIKEYRIGTGLTVNADSNITGGRLMGSNVTFDGSVDAKSDVTGTLYLSNAATVQGAKTTALTIGSAVQTSGTGSNEELHWSNEYNRDYTSSGSATGSTYTSYLLKSVGSTVTEYNHTPVVRTVRAAKYCGTKSYIIKDGYGKTVVDNTSRVTYAYADSITQTPNVKTQQCAMCQWGTHQVQFAGDVSKTKTTFAHPYNGIKDCPAGVSDQELCNQNCDPLVEECSYACLKQAANISGCGNELEQRMCFCPCPVTQTSYACMPSFYNSEVCDGDGSPAWGATCSQTDYQYEPKLGGTGKVLVCVAS